jgi:hypothetical protein
MLKYATVDVSIHHVMKTELGKTQSQRTTTHQLLGLTELITSAFVEKQSM